MDQQTIAIPVGTRFGYLTAIGYAGSKGGALWQCRCECGRLVEVRGKTLRAGSVTSCGKGFGESPEYQCWKNMKRRCLDPTNKRYARYGGRGIKVCDRWMRFCAFLSDIGSRPPGTTLDRIDNDGDYTPDNCRWASPTQQVRNSSKTRFVSFNGETMTVTEWANRLGITVGSMSYRLKRWNIEQALTQHASPRLAGKRR